ncbi:unnamed protein product [Staurois parvus]|uniref:NADH dehydrogenase subunit 4 n=1 Tax=Staurois parvus TaxID=386267 RepID=A0ABN9FJY7_9NEOB|nr:unnamed protein product [Staurois parvus]
MGGIVPHHWCQWGRNSAPSLVLVTPMIGHYSLPLTPMIRYLADPCSSLGSLSHLPVSCLPSLAALLFTRSGSSLGLL